MATDGRVVTCDISGCREELTLPGVDPAQGVEGDPEWTTVGGRHLCPTHSERRPWLS
jgi:hypothetical protein